LLAWLFNAFILMERKGQRAMAQLAFLIESLEHGAAQVTIPDSVQHLILFPSYSSDAFSE
jgi:hypothetical protein